MSQPPCTVIATLKGPSVPKAIISGPYLSLIEGALKELGIVLQVEDIDRTIIILAGRRGF